MFVLFVFCYSSLSSFGDSSSSNWKDANSLYQDQKYEEALHAMRSHPKEDSTYYYNLGTISYRLNHLGYAVGYLEKANRLHPHDPDIQHNLSIARSELIRKIGNEKIDPASSSIEQIADRIPLEEIRTLLGFIGVAVALLWVRAYLTTRNLKKAILNPTGMLGIFAMTLILCIYTIQRIAHASPPAICLERISVHSGPGNHFYQLSSLEEGAKVRLMGPAVEAQPSANHELSPSSAERWYQVRYSRDEIGWIHTSSLLTL
jgi:tetratricopeptide (TPR) repeat protein